VVEEKTFIAQLRDSKTQEAAFRELIKLYKERLYWHIRKIVIVHDDADDVLQNTFIKVYRNIDKFKEESKLYSWMYRIATNESITFLNQKAKLKNVDFETLQQEVIQNLESDVYFEGDEIQLKLQKALATLPQKQLIVFNMRYFDDIKYEEMAEILETSVGALKASYHHAKKKIETFLAND